MTLVAPGGSSHVVFVLPGLAPAPIGGYRVVYEYANYLASVGHDVSVIHAWPDSLGDPKKRLSDVRWLWLFGSAGAPRWFQFHPRIRIRNSRSLSQIELPVADTYVATSVETAPLVALAVRRNGGRGVYLIQGYETWAVDVGVLQESWRLPLQNVTVSPWLSELVDASGANSILIPNPVDIKQFEMGPRLGLRQISFGTMLSPAPAKRTDIALEVIERVASVLPEARARCFGIGRRPKDLPRRVEYLRLPDRDTLAEFYRSLTVFFCSSDSEGWYLPGTEAMASGASFVSTENGGVRGYADQYAHLVDVGDAGALSLTISDILRDPTVYEMEAAAGAVRVRKNDLAAASRRFEKVITGEGEQ